MSFTPSQVWACRSCGALNTTNHAKCVECGDSQVNKLLLSLEPCGDCDPCCAGQPNQCAVPIVAKSPKCKRSDGYDSQLEADWAVVMAERYGKAWRHHGFTLQLPVKDKDGRIQFDKYTPDFVAWEMPIHLDWRITAYECKGDHPWRRAGVERFKRFAEQTPWARFVLVERENGQWRETVV